MKTFKLFINYAGLLLLLIATLLSTFLYYKEKEITKRYNAYYISTESSLEAFEVDFPEQFDEFLQSMQFVEYYRARENLKDLLESNEK